jgi:hypothetical protein
MTIIDLRCRIGTDGRSWVLSAASSRAPAAMILYRPLAEDGLELLGRYNVEELAAVLRYLEDGRLQRAHAERIRRLGEARRLASTRREQASHRGVQTRQKAIR